MANLMGEVQVDSFNEASQKEAVKDISSRFADENIMESDKGVVGGFVPLHLLFLWVEPGMIDEYVYLASLLLSGFNNGNFFACVPEGGRQAVLMI